MDRQSRVLLGLVALLVALVALDRFWKPVDTLGNPDATRVVWRVDASDVTSIEAKHVDGQHIHLELRNDEWWVQAPFEGRANQRVASRMARFLGELSLGEPLDMNDPEDFGLGEPPLASVTVGLDGGRAALAIGRTAPSGWRTYVRGEEGPAVVDGEVASNIFLEPDELRDRHLLHYDPAAVRRVSVASEAGTLVLAGADREWWVEGYARADLDAVEQLVSGLLDLQVETFLEGALPDGIPSPVYAVTISLDGAPDLVLRVGEETPLGRIVAVDGGSVGAVPAAALAVLGQPPTGLSDPLAFPIRQVKPRRAQVEFAGNSWEATFEEDGWVRPGVDGREVFATMEILRTVATAPQLEPVPPITEVEGRVVLTDEAGTQRVVELGQRLGDRRVVVDRAGGEPYLVVEAGLTALLESIGASP